MALDTNVLVWSEETVHDDVYPNDINSAVAEHLNEHPEFVAQAVHIDEPDQGVSEDRLEWADALVWWGHARHDDVREETVDRVEEYVTEEGVGFLALHSAHYALTFKRLVGASGDLGEVRWEDIPPGETEELEVVDPDHPIAAGVEDFTLPEVEMFGEPFDVPEPDDVVLHSTFPEGGEFRSLCTFTFGAARGAYFRPGHEEFRIYHDENVRRVVANAVRWVARE